MGQVLEIEDVISYPGDPDAVWGQHLDVPAAGVEAQAHALDVSGWALGRRSPVVAVEFVNEGSVIGWAPVGDPREDVATAFPGIGRAELSGFRTSVPAFGRSPVLELEARTVLRDRSRVPLGVIRARRRWEVSAAQAIASLVSVIITGYNHARYLSESIESALDQTYPHVEVIVVDDGSTDNTREIASRYAQARYVWQPRQGLGAARNTGLRRSMGDLVVFLDADDRLLSDGLEAGVEALRAHPDAAFVWGTYHVISFDGSLVAKPVAPPVPPDPFRALLERNYIEMHATVMYRRAIFEYVSEFSTALDACEDYELYLRITREFPVHPHHKAVAQYRRHGATMTRDAALMLRTRLTVLRSQRPYAMRSPELRQAFATGKRHYLEHYSGQLVTKAGIELRSRHWHKGLGSFLVLLRFYPRGLSKLLRYLLA